MFKKIKLLALPLALTAPIISNAEIEVDVDIILEDISVLYSFTDIDVNFDPAALGTIISNGSACTAGTLTAECDMGDAGGPVTAVPVGPGSLSATFDINSSLPLVNAVDLTLRNVWAVRAIGGTTANTTVEVSVAGGTVISNGASQIGVTSGSASPSTFADPGLGDPQIGDVTLTLDMSTVTTSGTYDSGSDTGDVTYSIEVTAI